LRALAVIGILLFALLRADSLTRLADASAHPGIVVHAEQSAYQRIVLTELAGELRLFLNGHLQFSSRDEHRYHEALVHPALSLAVRRQDVMIGGGGDGLAAREVLRWPDVERVTLVDLDPAMTRLFAQPGPGRALNAGALADARVEIRNEDALLYLRQAQRQFDVILLDFPDPSNYAVGKLYSAEFYRLVEARLRTGGIVAVQATSPLFARSAFWCVARTLESAGLHTLPYRVFLPSFGEWGFVLAARGRLARPTHIPLGDLRYLNDQRLASLFVFPPDMSRVPVEVNRFDNQALVGYYAREWERWN
jgi:spermidine synthase